MKIAQIVTVALLLLVSVRSFAVVKMGSFFIPGYVDFEKEALFTELNKEIFSRLDKHFDLIVEPVQKARISFLTKNTHVIFPELHESLVKYMPSGNYVVSESFWKKRIFLYQRKDSAFTQIEDLYGRRIGAVRGYSYGMKLTKNADLKIHYTNNDIMNIKMLLAGSFEAVLGDDSSTQNAVELAGGSDLIHAVELPFSALDVFYACRGDVKGIDLCKEISAVIRELKSEGIIDLRSKIPKIDFEAEKAQNIIQ